MLLNIEQAARYCGYSRRTLYNWLDKGYMRLSQTTWGSPRIDHKDLEEAVRKARAANPKNLGKAPSQFRHTFEQETADACSQ